MPFVLTPENLSFANLELIFREKPLLELPSSYLAGISSAPPATAKTELAQNYLLSHAVSFGPSVPEEIIRLALFIQIFSVVHQYSQQISLAIQQRLLAFYNREVFPVVQVQGSPASQATQMCLPLLGKGKVNFQGYELQAADVNEIFSWEPLALTPGEVTYFVNQPVFTYAESAINLIKLQPLVQWQIYLLELFNQISSDDPMPFATHKMDTTLTKVKNAVVDNINLPIGKQNLPLLRDALEELLTQIYYLNEALVAYNTEALDNLIASAEPPATTVFNLAAALVISIHKQLNLKASNSENIVFTRANINILNEVLANNITYGEQLAGIAFWSVAQVGKLYTITPQNLTLSAYYHSALYVPKEMVSEQLEKAILFIRSTSPKPVA
jgi:hypothetical protein